MATPISWQTSWSSAVPDSTDTHRPCHSGSVALDGLFVHGLPSSSVIEIIGGSGSGKTALCLSTICATAAMGKRVLAIDTSNGFAKTRLLELIASHRSASGGIVAGSSNVSGSTSLSRKSSMSSLFRDGSDILSRIVLMRARDPWTLLTLLTTAADGHRTADTRRVPVQQGGGDENNQFLGNSGAEDCSYDLIVVDCLYTLIAPYMAVAGVGSANAVTGSASSSTGYSGGSSGGQTAVNVDSLVTSIGLMLRRLSTRGCCVIATNVAPKQPPYQRHHQSHSFSPHGSLSAPLNDIFGVILSVTSYPVALAQPSSQSQSSQSQLPQQQQQHQQQQPSHDTVIRIEVLLRPPYYGNQPTVVDVRVSQLCCRAST